MLWLFAGLSMFAAVIAWLAAWRGWERVELAGRLGAPIALLPGLWLSGMPLWPAILLSLALVCWLAREVLYSVHRHRLGVIAGGLAHAGWLAVLLSVPPPINLPALVMAVLSVLAAWTVYRRVGKAIVLHAEHKPFTALVLIYGGLSTATLLGGQLTLIHTDEVWPFGPALLTAAGALLIYMADLLGVWKQYVSPPSFNRVGVMALSHLGLIALVSGLALWAAGAGG